MKNNNVDIGISSNVLVRRNLLSVESSLKTISKSRFSNMKQRLKNIKKVKNIKIKRSKKDTQVKTIMSDKIKSATLMKNYIDHMNESVCFLLAFKSIVNVLNFLIFFIVHSTFQRRL